MGFSCECDFDEAPSFYGEKMVKARKPHTCCECGHEITTGQEYMRITGMWDGEFRTHCQCERCADLSEAFSAVGYCMTFGELFSDYAEWLDEILPNGRARARAIRAKHREWAPNAPTATA